MMITLTLYFLLQRMYRQSVPADAPRKEQRTTSETILRAFSLCTANPPQTPRPRSSAHSPHDSPATNLESTRLRNARPNPQPPPSPRPLADPPRCRLSCSTTGVAENGTSTFAAEDFATGVFAAEGFNLANFRVAAFDADAFAAAGFATLANFAAARAATFFTGFFMAFLWACDYPKHPGSDTDIILPQFGWSRIQATLLTRTTPRRRRTQRHRPDL